MTGSRRLWAFVFPPVGLWLLWRTPGLGWVRKLLGTLFLALYALIEFVAIIALLVFTAGLEIEWRGGLLPVPTFHKTKPDYAALDQHRRRPASRTATPQPVPGTWTDFRGPRRDGHYDETPIRSSWPESGLKKIWRQPVGGGYAAFVVANGQAYTIEQRRENEAVVCYDLATGLEQWADIYPAFFNESMGGEGPRATPTFSAGKIYAQGAMGDLRCLDGTSGQVIWKRNILADHGAENLYYGVSASPLVDDGRVIVQTGGTNGASVVAYDAGTGEVRWKTLNDAAAYSSPMRVALAGVPQILIVTEHRAVGLHPATGELLWEFPWVVQMRNRNIAQPVLVSRNRFFLSAGYGTGCCVVEVEKAGTGAFHPREVWRNKFLKNKFSSSVYRDGYLYGLDEDILTCVDAATGARRWKEGRYGYGQLLLAGTNLVILAGDGDLALVRATPDRYEQTGRFRAIHGKTWNHPAIAGGKILVRNAVEMACYDAAP